MSNPDESMPTPPWVGALGILGPLVFMAAWVGSGLKTPGYSPVSDAISELAQIGSKTRWQMSLGFVAFGLAVPAFAALVGRFLPGSCRVALAVSGVATLGVAAVPLGAGLDSLHGAFASAGYAGIAAAPLLAASAWRGSRTSLSGRAHPPPPWGPSERSAWSMPSLVAGIASAVCLLATVVGPAHGFFQRGGLTIGDLWIVAVSLRLLRGERAVVQAR